jgi:hypothetical protein
MLLLLLLLLLFALLVVDLASLLNDQRDASLKSLGVSHGEHHMADSSSSMQQARLHWECAL